MAGTLGAQLYSVRQHTQNVAGIAESLRKVRAIGYTAIQVSGFGAVDARELARVLDDSGLTVASTHMSWHRFTGDLEALIEEHKLWKCRHPAIGGLPGEYFADLDGVSRFLDELAPIAERLAAEGMDFSYHNHNHELARSGGSTWLGTLYAKAGPSVLKAEIDTYWIQAGGGDPAQWIRDCAGREPLVHLKDMVVMPDREVRFAPVGEGNLNWPAILDACRAGGVEYYLVEQDQTYGQDAFECLAVSYRNLRGLGLR